MHAPPPHLPGSYLVLELTNRCSLACVHCSVAEGTAHPHHRRTGYLDPELARSLLDDLAAVGARFDTAVLFWLGEPLLHPYFADIWRSFLRAAGRQGTFRRVEVHTNATHLTADLARAFLNQSAVEQPLHFSLDAANAATYRRVKGLDRFEAVRAHVEGFLDARTERSAPWPRPVFQFIVGPNNAGDAEAFADHWTRACRTRGQAVRLAAGHVPSGEDAVVFFKQLDAPTPGEQVAANAVFRAEMARMGLAIPPEAPPRHAALEAGQGLAVCSAFWKSPVVSWLGEVTVCTRDSRLENTLGNLHERPFSQLWWGDGQRERRQRVSVGDYRGLPACDGCFIPHSLNHGNIEAAEVRAQEGWDRRAVG